MCVRTCFGVRFIPCTGARTVCARVHVCMCRPSARLLPFRVVFVFMVDAVNDELPKPLGPQGVWGGGGGLGGSFSVGLL